MLSAHLRIHTIFHISLLKRYIHDPIHIIDWNVAQVENLRILDRKETTLRNRVITQVKVQWKHFSPEEVTWELEEEM